LLLSIAVPLLLFLGITVAVLDHRFQTLADDALHAQLESELIALITSSDPDEAGAIAPLLKSAESRFMTPGSGMYARVVNRRGLQVWRSPSNAGVKVDYGPPLLPGKTEFREVSGAPGTPKLAVLSRGLRWEDERGRRLDLTFTVAMSLAEHDAQLFKFRRELTGLFLLVGFGMLVALGILLRWALRPLRELSRQIGEVEAGERERLDSPWPRELRGVVANLNVLLDGERNRIARYRDTLGNLAHSLKTPLAVIRSSLSGKDPAAIAAAVDEQVVRMTTIVEHQLKRAVGGGPSVGRAVPVAPIAQDLRVALLKAHAGKDFSLEVAVDASAQFAGDKDDLYEALGNLMQNAAKWCASRVRVSGSVRELVDGSRRLEIHVEDDGPGIPATERERVIQRGARADEVVPGHGLGLAMVRDFAQLYGGEIMLGDSSIGGARLSLLLPGR
jgi:two-component system sensor histidine kinase PhoQ